MESVVATSVKSINFLYSLGFWLFRCDDNEAERSDSNWSQPSSSKTSCAEWGGGRPQTGCKQKQARTKTTTQVQGVGQKDRQSSIDSRYRWPIAPVNRCPMLWRRWSAPSELMSLIRKNIAVHQKLPVVESQKRQPMLSVGSAGIKNRAPMGRFVSIKRPSWASKSSATTITSVERTLRSNPEQYRGDLSLASRGL